MHRKIVTRKCDWGMGKKGIPYRKGGMLTLSEFRYDDGNEGYRITAIGLDMMDNFRRNQYPTNIDLKDLSQEEVMDIYNELLTGPSKELDRKVRAGELNGWSPNLHSGQYERGEVAQAVSSPFLAKSVIGGGGFISMDSNLIREEAKRSGMSEDCLIKKIVAHESDHQELNRINRQSLIVDGHEEEIFDEREKEIRGNKKGAEAMLKGGYVVRTGYLVSDLVSYKEISNSLEASDIVSSWIREWSEEYPDLLIVNNGQYELEGTVYDNYDIVIPKHKEQRDRYTEEDSLRSLKQKEIEDWYPKEISDDELRSIVIDNGTYDPSDEEEDGTELVDNREFNLNERRRKNVNKKI